MHPSDAAARGLVEGAQCELVTERGTIALPVEITDDMMPGVVSAPHGFGHDREGTRADVARAHAGVSINDVTDEGRLDRLSGNAAFSGQPVRVRAASRAVAAE
jgi:anaerobic selenocysteine-containing dehydrogenase